MDYLLATFLGFMVSGIFCGAMMNISLENKIYDKEGILGGIIVGILMFFL